MRVECITRFKDLQALMMREVGDVFECSDERYKQLNGTRYGQIVRTVDAEPEQAPEDTPQEAVESPETDETEPTAPVTRGRRNRRAYAD